MDFSFYSDSTTNPSAFDQSLLDLSHPSPISGLSHQNPVVKNNLGEMLDQTFGKRQRTLSFDEMTSQSEKEPRVIFLMCDFILTHKTRGSVYLAISNSKVIHVSCSLLASLTFFLIALKVTNHQKEVSSLLFFKQMRSLVFPVARGMPWEGPLIKCST